MFLVHAIIIFFLEVTKLTVTIFLFKYPPYIANTLMMPTFLLMHKVILRNYLVSTYTYYTIFNIHKIKIEKRVKFILQALASSAYGCFIAC